MQNSSQRSHGTTGPRAGLGRKGGGVQSAIRFAVVAAAAAVGFFIVAVLWVSTCRGELMFDTAACGVPQRTLLALGAPGILLAGGGWAFVQTYRVWREHGTWWPWQGAGWFLLTLMLLTLTMGVPPIAGPAMAG
jgi:hypothetical protein